MKEPAKAKPGKEISFGDCQPANWQSSGGANPDRKPRLPREISLQKAIGQEVRAARFKHGLTMKSLAAEADIAIGTLSKIENGIISPSLSTLLSLSLVLGLPLASFFRRHSAKSAAVFVKGGQGRAAALPGLRRSDSSNDLGFGDTTANGIAVRPSLITLKVSADEFPLIHHDGMQFLYMLEGEVIFGHGTKRYLMAAGDSLCFDGKTPHRPSEITKSPVRLLSIISTA